MKETSHANVCLVSFRLVVIVDVPGTHSSTYAYWFYLPSLNLRCINDEKRGERIIGWIDGVFSGGGMKGFALVGAYQVLEEKGYQFKRVAGTSAGAILACFIAAGYTGKEIEEY